MMIRTEMVASQLLAQTTGTTTGVAICDSARLFREGLQHVLAGTRFEVVAAIRTLAEWDGEADVVIWGHDPAAPADQQVEELTRLTARYPDVRFVALADPADPDIVRPVAEAGVDAVLSRDISGEILRRVLELVVLGQQLFPPPGRLRPAAAASAGLRRPPSQPRPRGDVSLSEREAQILECLVGGASNKVIARDLDITEGTVKVHIKGLLRKVRARNRTQAAIWGVEHGYGPADRAMNSGSAHAA